MAAVDHFHLQQIDQRAAAVDQAIAFGSQIRNYVMQPYQMVKDLRTREQTGDINRVLDGDIDQFIKAYLVKKAAGALAVPAEEEEE